MASLSISIWSGCSERNAMLITIIEIKCTWVSQTQKEVGHGDVAVNSGRCMQGAEEYMM